MQTYTVCVYIEQAVGGKQRAIRYAEVSKSPSVTEGVGGRVVGTKSAILASRN